MGMDYESRLVEARLNVIEAVLLRIVGRDPALLGDVQQMLAREYDAARETAEHRETAVFQAKVHVEMKAPRDTAGEAARVEAYRRLAKMFGADISG